MNAVTAADNKAAAAATGSNGATVPSDTSFQCVLNAATSPATKLDEETLTYLNQGQSYELRIKKLGGEQQEYNGKLFKVIKQLSTQWIWQVAMKQLVILYKIR